MRVINVEKEYIYEPSPGVKIKYRMLPRSVFASMVVKHELFKSDLSNEPQEPVDADAVEETIRPDPNKMLLVSRDLVNYPGAVFGWEGVLDQDGDVLEFDPKHLDGIDDDTVIIKLASLITNKFYGHEKDEIKKNEPTTPPSTN